MNLQVYPSSKSAPLILLNCYGDEGEGICRAVKELTDRPFSLAVISGLDWNRDMSPWAAEAVFKGESPFSGGADEYLNELTGKILPSILADLPTAPTATYIAGYSMAGLFALYSLYKTSVFDGAASCSGSLWYPGFREYVDANEFSHVPSKVYLSVGDKEARTRNKLMAMVEENTRAICDLYASRGIDTHFDLNAGNHFSDAELRTAKGIAWLI